MGRQQRLKPDERREQLLQAALACLREDGLQALTLERVSLRSGTSIALIGRYFGGRAGLIAALYRAVVPAVPEHVETETEAQVLRALGDFFESHFDPDYYSPENLSVWTAIFSAMRSNTGLQTEFVEGETAMTGHLARLVGRLAELRGRQIAARRVSASLLAMLDGLWLHATLAPGYLTAQDARAMAQDYLEAQVGPLGF